MYAGLFMHAWDLADDGVEPVMEWAAHTGITALHIASSYHTGWFIHPHNSKHRTYMPEDGCVYFHPSAELYTDTLLRPKVAGVSMHRDWIREATIYLDRYGLNLVAWTVCLHNTQLGLIHPECTVTNCFDDRYPYALCPANQHVRNYVTDLCRDLATNLPISALQLESIGFQGFHHGHHHEHDAVCLTPLEKTLLGFCFCVSCIHRAEEMNVDIRKVQHEVRSTLDAAMAHAPDRPRGHPTTMAEFMSQHPELERYGAYRREIVDSLIREIKATMPPRAKLAILGSYNPHIADLVNVFTVGAYGKNAEETASITACAKEPLHDNHELHVGIRLGMNAFRDVNQLTEVVKAVRDSGGDGVEFYNYSEAPMRMLNWIKPAMARARLTPKPKPPEEAETEATETLAAVA